MRRGSLLVSPGLRRRSSWHENTRAAAARRVEPLERRTLLAATLSGNVLTVSGDDGGAATADVILLRRGSAVVGGATVATAEVTVNGKVQFNAPLPADARIDVNGGSLGDTLAVSFADGNPVPRRGLTFNGGAGADTLALGASTFSGFTVTFNGGGSAFSTLPSPDAIVATVTGGTDLTLTNGLLDNPAAGGGSVSFTAVGSVELVGGTGSNVFDASAFAGRAELRGGAGDDTLLGGRGADALEGGDGDDYAAGGDGNDTYVFGPAAVTQTDEVEERDGDGSDTLSFAGLPASDPVTVALNNFINTASHTRRTVNAIVPTVSAFLEIENVVGGAGDDNLNGERRQPNRLVGGPGNDRLHGGSIGDTVGGFIDGDTLEGGAGDDLLIGGDGGDLLLGQAGSDEIFGDADNDTYVFEGTSAGEFLDVVSSGGSVHFTLFAHRRATAGGAALETDTVHSVERLQVLALGGADTVDLTGISGASILQQIIADGGAGSDTLLGSGNDDDLRGGTGADPDRLEGNGGDDTLAGGDGFDTLLGGDGDDVATESGGNFIDLGLGEDGLLLLGTDGDDEIFIGWEPGPRAVFTVNGAVVHAGDYLNGETIFVQAGDGDDRVSMSADAALRWRGDFSGGDGRDRLEGGGNHDRLDGGAGDDLLIGNGGDDDLFGGAGRDRLEGGDGDDRLDGGPGARDLYQGGPGADHLLAADGEADLLFADADDLLLATDPVDLVNRRRASEQT